MLQEVRHTQQFSNEPFRRWFCDSMFDLIVWYTPDSNISGFQLCYNKGSDEHVLTWQKDTGFSHNRIDDGENRGARHKMTPILVPDGTFEKDNVIDLFERESKALDSDLVEIVTEKIKKYPHGKD